MTAQVPAGAKRPVRQAPPPLKLDDVRVTANGARPRVTLMLSRPLTEYEARVAWEFFPLASAKVGSTKITLRTPRTRPSRARLERDVSRMFSRAVVLERQHQRILKQYRSAAKAQHQAAAKVAKKPPWA